MSEICVHAISKTFRNAPAPAVDDVSFTVGQGEMLVLLGPSGCGKTTTLRCIAGLEQPTQGTITIGDTVVFDRDRRINVPSNKRDIGLVFQTFALWPHLSARENIAFPLTTRRVRKADRLRIVDDVARMVDLDAGLLEKRPAKLSGGQQQRVALARALVAEPTVVLFDEPLSNLDALLREQLRIDLRLLHKRIGFSGVYVTHDLTEGATIGDRVAVMREGHMEQLGPSADVFEKPATSAVGRLLGLRQLCSLHQDQGRWRCGTNGNGADGLDFRGPAPIGSSPAAVDVFVRPDRLALHPEGTADAGGLTLHGGRVDECLYVGGGNELIVSLGRHRLRLARGRDERWSKGDRVVVEAPWADVRFFSEAGAVPGDALFDPDSVEVTA